MISIKLVPSAPQKPLSVYLRGAFHFKLVLHWYYILWICIHCFTSPPLQQYIPKNKEVQKSFRLSDHCESKIIDSRLLFSPTKITIFIKIGHLKSKEQQDRQFRQTPVRRNVGKRTRLPRSRRLRSRHFPPPLRAAFRKISLP